MRAVLSILRVDPDEVGAQLGDTGLRGPDAERVLLVGLLHRIASSELREVVTTMMDDTEAARAAARSTLPVNGENPTEQVRFDAHWLHDRIGALAAGTTVDPVPVLLDAAARSTDAAEVLLLLSRNPRGHDADTRWERALDDLGRAYHLINDERVGRSNTTTAPL
ncbi:hypothetical protein IU470_29610 [Nocardia abscessus]|uniref:Uncharacterized protein n=1 Tax=Nocardia abscessus TaxID=120957 RepID=A0ABS0CH71_9NOCA|nr:hypothetical protein [Nocardia abscessus]MBF6229235.1 hypothetical protein [Nocardia abscessus]